MVDNHFSAESESSEGPMEVINTFKTPFDRLIRRDRLVKSKKLTRKHSAGDRGIADLMKEIWRAGVTLRGRFT